MKPQINPYAVIYTLVAIVLLIVGYIQKSEPFLYWAIILFLVSFYWMFRDKIKMIFWSREKLTKHNKTMVLTP